MATITTNKTERSLQASATNTAGSTTTGTAVDLRTTLGGLATLTITNGGTGPTVACDAIVEVSSDNSTWSELARVTAGVANSGAYTFQVLIPESVMYARSKFVGNTGQSVTVIAVLHELTSYTSA